MTFFKRRSFYVNSLLIKTLFYIRFTLPTWSPELAVLVGGKLTGVQVVTGGQGVIGGQVVTGGQKQRIFLAGRFIDY